MKMVKSLLLGSAAGLVAVAGAQAADLPVKAKPVQYVKICSLYGAGFFYIPGTDTCIKIGGFMRAEWNVNAAGSFKPSLQINTDNRDTDRETTRTRGLVSFDVRSQTEYGALRAYLTIAAMSTNANANANLGQGVGGSPYALPFSPAAFIQFAGFTFGSTASFFDFDGIPYSNQTNYWNSAQGGNGIPVLAYTAQFGNGLSGSLSIEDTTSRRVEYTAASVATSALTGTGGNLNTGILGPYGAGIDGYAGRRWPDVVGNLHVDQAWGSAQVMGAIHQVRGGYYAGTFALSGTAGLTGNPSDEVGYAVGGGLKFNLPMLGKGDYVQGQVTYAVGAMNYVMNQGGGGALLLQSGGPTQALGLTSAYGPVFDATYGTVGSGLDLTSGWSVTAGYEHMWTPMWKTSVYGSYGAFEYSATSSARIAQLAGFGPALAAAGAAYVAPAGAALTAGSANWDMWQVGSRTVWTPVANLDLSVDVIYSSIDTAFAGLAPATSTTLGTFGDKNIWSAIFRAQRNFYP